MTTFDERKDAFERKFVLDEEQRFRAMARRNKLLGEWAAAKLGKSGDEASSYARTVVASDLAESGEDDVFRKVKADLAGSVTDEEIRRAMAELLHTAQEQVASGQ